MVEHHIPQLNSAIKRGATTTKAANWLENMINPFPDYQERPVGVPSEAPAHTAVKIVQKVINISAPALAPTSSKWTANVFLLPVDSATDIPSQCPLYSAGLFTQHVGGPGALLNQTGNDGNFGLLMVVKAWDDDPDSANPFSPNFEPADAEIQFVGLADTWVGQGAVRLASLGYEIVDNTPELYRGGSMVNWRKTSAAFEQSMYYDTEGDVGYFNDHVRSFTGLPASLADAFRIPGSTQTRFTDGTYVTATFNRNLEEFENCGGYRGCVIVSDIPAPSDATSRPALIVGGYENDQTPGSRHRFFRPFAYTHVDHSGSFCTGLAPEATFTLSLKAVLEVLPNTNSTMIDFASKSQPTDPKMLQLYSNIAAQMPVSAPVADNDAGEWFKKMLKIAGPLIADIFPEVAPLIKPATALANKGIDALSAHHKKKKAENSRAVVKYKNKQHIR